nr:MULTISPECIES: LuxR C-terminal-related transcriptional regulator [unclassified Leptolyngbya]
MEPEAIAQHVTEALVQQFDCVFARIWLVEPDQAALRLVSSSGLYTHINGSFARIAMGAYKVGKIAQNRIPFLSNHLADESWVKDREWAIANNIQGFAGYPLLAGDRVIGVLATFSDRPLAPEFLEVLQVLCMTTSIALDAAVQIQQMQPRPTPALPINEVLALSEHLATVLSSTRPMLVGTEQPLPPASTYIFLKVAEVLNRLQCNYCRLIYSPQSVSLEAIAPVPKHLAEAGTAWVRSHFEDLRLVVTCLGGTLKTQLGSPRPVVQVLLTLPYPTCTVGPAIAIQCSAPALQAALTHLAYLAGLSVCESSELDVLLLTDDFGATTPERPLIWLRCGSAGPVPPTALAIIDLSIQPNQLRALVEQVQHGKSAPCHTAEDNQQLSEREQEIMRLLVQGMRDRDIAQHLFISESTVKFHINNSLTKLNAKNRYQAVYQAAIRGWV